MLEGIFKFWRNSDKKTFDIEQEWLVDLSPSNYKWVECCNIMSVCADLCNIYRERRLRHYLAQRYDSRKGVYDWDYHMKLQEMVSIVKLPSVFNTFFLH